MTFLFVFVPELMDGLVVARIKADRLVFANGLAIIFAKLFGTDKADVRQVSGKVDFDELSTVRTVQMSALLHEMVDDRWQGIPVHVHLAKKVLAVLLDEFKYPGGFII